MSQYFDKKFIESQKKKLLCLKTEMMNRLSSQDQEEFHVRPEDTMEDGDQAQTYLSQNVSIGLRAREINKLKLIDAALYRIDNGNYGVCEETEEPISKKRLEKMPWTTLSIEAAEKRERDTKRKGA